MSDSLTSNQQFGPVVYGTLTARDRADVTRTLWTETGEWVAVEDFNRLQAMLEEPPVLGAGCGIAPMPTATDGIEAAVRVIQKICAEAGLDPAQWLNDGAAQSPPETKAPPEPGLKLCEHVWTHQTADIWCCENCGIFQRRAVKTEGSLP
jgi:hypothetical protein